MGKGSGRRPTDDKKYSDNYDRIFGKKEKADDKSLTDVVKEHQGGKTVKVNTEDL